MDSSTQQDSINVNGILSANALSYRLPPDLSISTSRNLQSQFFASQSYAPGAVAAIVLNTGSQFVDFTRSFLVMTVRNLSTAGDGVTAQNVWFGPNGSACNLINRCQISSRSGTTLELLQNCNQYASYKLALERDIGHTGKVGSAGGAGDPSQGAGVAMMYGHTPAPITDANYDWANGESLRFCIPFSAFSPLLGNARSLWPSVLCSGMRMELTLESPQIALMTTSANAGDLLNYVIDEIRIEAECYTISDLALRAINAQALTGLDILSESVHNTPATRSGGSANVDNGRSVSRALGFVYRERPAQLLATSTQDKFACVPVSSASYPIQYQARIGGWYLPQQGIKNISGALGYRTVPYEVYATIAQKNFGSMGGMATNLVQFMQSRFQFVQSLERSNVIDLAGVPLNNSRQLTVSVQWNAAPAANTLIDFFLQYACLIRAFAAGVNIEV